MPTLPAIPPGRPSASGRVEQRAHRVARQRCSGVLGGGEHHGDPGPGRDLRGVDLGLEMTRVRVPASDRHDDGAEEHEDRQEQRKEDDDLSAVVARMLAAWRGS